MRWVILSPHFDDAVLSCGGWIWEQVRQGDTVEAWTICAGAPPEGTPLSPFAASLHERWQTGPQAVQPRRAEDEEALGWLGAGPRYWDLPDCIYRRLPGSPGSWLVNGEEDLWQPVHPDEQVIVDRLAAWLAANLSTGDGFIAPLTLGGHVDHRLVRAAAEQAAARMRISLWYYADYPYAVRQGGEMGSVIEDGWHAACREISPQGLRAWQDAVACYRSQMSTFWQGRAELDAEIENYWRDGGGSCLWSAALLENAS
jgi:LmbE family N-acetylglucosaminyl deacetylase